MEESEKMRGLKKAYAEIILNTAKEAAARIMVSEKKVQQVNHDLSYTKDEALRLLLRLKQTMDSKLNEAEMKSRHQQRRIEELEAQLQEAEDIVSNLRAELNEAHVKMAEMEKNQMHTRPNMTEKATCEKERSNSFEENGYIGVPDVQSGIVRSKKPEVCVNGCTQRVHAYEENFLNGHVPIAGELDDIKDGKILREDLEGSDVGHMVGKELVNVVDVNNVDIFSCTGQVSKAFRKKRRFAARRRRSGSSLLKSLPPMDEEARSDDMLEIHNDEVKGKISVSPSTTPLNILEMGALSEHVVDAEGDDEVAEAQTNAMEEDKEFSRSSVLIREKNGSRDSSDVARSNLELETNNVSSTSLDAKVQNVDECFPDLRPKDRVLKYTFHRKRKKEALSSDDGSLLPQENPAKRKSCKKQNSGTEQRNFSLGAESSRDSRRMAQVARQLISLSENKWWK